MCICIYIYTHIHTHTYTHTHAHTHTYIYIYTCTCTCTVCACIHVYMLKYHVHIMISSCALRDWKVQASADSMILAPSICSAPKSSTAAYPALRKLRISHILVEQNVSLRQIQHLGAPALWQPQSRTINLSIFATTHNPQGRYNFLGGGHLAICLQANCR